MIRCKIVWLSKQMAKQQRKKNENRENSAQMWKRPKTLRFRKWIMKKNWERDGEGERERENGVSNARKWQFSKYLSLESSLKIIWRINIRKMPFLYRCVRKSGHKINEFSFDINGREVFWYPHKQSFWPLKVDQVLKWNVTCSNLTWNVKIAWWQNMHKSAWKPE